MERMKALDAGFLQLEDEHVALHIGAIAIFDGPPPSDAEIFDRYVRLLTTFPRYGQLLRRWPRDLRRPGWVDAARVDLDFHLRRSALPAPGTPQQLERLVGRLMSYRLDPDRPLWEAWIVEGLEDGRWALVMKVHHSVVDGVGGMATFAALLDGARDLPPQRAEAGRSHAPRVRVLAKVGRAPAPSPVLAQAIGAAQTAARLLRPAGNTSLTGTVGTARRYRAMTVELDDVRRVRDAFGGTVNDVVLALVTAGFRSLLAARHELGTGPVRSLVPVSVRGPEEDVRGGGNRITFLIIQLPVEVGDPVRAYAVVRRRIGRLKRSGEGAAAAGGLAAADLIPSAFVRAALGAARHVPQRIVTTVTTNVPGPSRPATMLGRRLLALYPYVPIGEQLRIAVAVTTYAGRLQFGVTCDRASVPDADLFVDAMADALIALVKEAQARVS